MSVSSITSKFDNFFESSLSCKEIYKQNAPTFSKEQPAIPGSPQGNAQKFIRRQEALLRRYELYSRKTCFDICGRVLNLSHISSDIINMQTCRDLNLFSGSQNFPNSYLGGSMGEVLHTQMGMSYFLNVLAHPTDRVAPLKRRQKIVREFAENNELHKELTLLLKNMGKTNEAEILSFWSGRMQLPGCLASLFYRNFGTWNEVLNNNTHLLEASSLYVTGKKALGLVTKGLLIPMGVLSAANAIGAVNTPQSIENYTRHFAANEYVRTVGFFSEDSPSLQFFTAITATSIALSTIRGTYAWFYADTKVASIVQNKLVCVARHYRSMKMIYEKCKTNSSLRENLEHFEKLEAFFRNKDLASLFAALESKTFDMEAEYLFNTGNILIAWNFLQDPTVRQEYEKALIAVSEIDMFIGIASHIREGNYCFPNYVTSATPIIQLEGFWNPQIARENATINSISLQSNKSILASNCIITGQNGSGKSTIIRGIFDAVLLSQTVGVSPGNKACLTPFSYIRTSMPKRDDTGRGFSGFTGEVANMKEITNYVQESLPRSSFALIALDEPYKSTSHESAELLAKETLMELGCHKQVSLIVSSNEKTTVESVKDSNLFLFLKVSEQKLTSGTYDDVYGGLRVAEKKGFRKTISSGLASMEVNTE